MTQQQFLEHNDEIIETINEINQAMEEKVRTIFLEPDFYALNSDKWLIFRIWRDFDLWNVVHHNHGIFIPYNCKSKLTKTETITRARRKIQEEARDKVLAGDHSYERFLPTSWEVRERRFGREIAHRIWARGKQ